MPRASDRAQTVIIPGTGEYRARNFCIVDLGTQESFFNGQPKEKREIFFGFELSDTSFVFQQDKGAQPFMVNFTEGVSTHEKSNLRKSLEDWRGMQLTKEEIADTDEVPLVNKFFKKPCMIVVRHDVNKKADLIDHIIVSMDGSKKEIQSQRIYANIGGIRRIPKESKTPTGQIIQHAVEAPAPINEPVLFDIDDPSTHENFSKVFPWLQKKIENSPEWKAVLAARSSGTPVAQAGTVAQKGDDF